MITSFTIQSRNIEKFALNGPVGNDRDFGTIDP